VNAKGGLLGRPVELIYYDDQSAPTNVPAITEANGTAEHATALDMIKVSTAAEFPTSGAGRF
jgi:hypothetical protein